MALSVTESVAAMLIAILNSTEHDPDQVIRLVSNSLGNLSVVLDSETKGDRIVKHEGTTAMVVESSLSTDLSEFTLDVEETSEGYNLTLFGVETDKQWNTLLTSEREVLASWRAPLI